MLTTQQKYGKILLPMWKGGRDLERDRFEAFTTLVTNASRSITKIKHRGMEGYGLGSTHTVCLRKLCAAPEGLTRTQLAKVCELDKAQISRIIGELFDKGYVISPTGGYKCRVMLSDSGRRVAEEINRLVLDINEFVSGEIPQQDIEAFYSVFARICDGLKMAENYFNGGSQKNI